LTTGGGGCSVSSLENGPQGRLGLLLGALGVLAARRLRRKEVAA
jgi:MYXO-CTERM domain-containing protein